MECRELGDEVGGWAEVGGVGLSSGRFRARRWRRSQNEIGRRVSMVMKKRSISIERYFVLRCQGYRVTQGRRGAYLYVGETNLGRYASTAEAWKAASDDSAALEVRREARASTTHE